MGGVTGHQSASRRIRSLGSPAAQRRIGAAIFVGAQEIQAEASRLITTGAVSGKNHVPSAPGEPPNEDTGHLRTNIEAVRTGKLTAEVESKARYALALEFGTSNMEERPYMRPATAAKRGRVHELVRGVVSQILRAGR